MAVKNLETMQDRKVTYPSKKRSRNKKRVERKIKTSKETIEKKSINNFADRCVKSAFQAEKSQKCLWNAELKDLFPDAVDKNDCSTFSENDKQCHQFSLNNNKEESSQYAQDEEICDNEMKKPSLLNVGKNTNASSFSVFGIILCFLSLFLAFMIRFNPYQDKTSVTSKELKICKGKLRRLTLLNRKLLKKINKRICSKRKCISKKKTLQKNCIKNVLMKNRIKLRNLTEGVINGRRIVDFNYIWKELRNNLEDHDSKKCCLQDWRFEKEAFYHGGLRTQFIFKCMSCNRKCRIWSEGLSANQMELNEASVLSLLVEGIGYTQMEGVLAGMGLSYITDKTFKYHQERLLGHLETISENSMKDANRQEFELAKKAGDIDENGTPFITVIVDGSWLTRSYGTKYDSLSGIGAIIGQRTGKVLYVGIKNKYCTKCFRAERCGKQPKAHNCYKNFTMSTPSTLMESEALVEGFKKSLKNHGLIYKYFVGDGDSNFYKKLLDSNPYAHLNIVPHKIECTNHLLRNLCKKARTVTTITQKKSERKKGFVMLRNLVKDNILKVRQTVVEEVDRVLADSSKTWQEKKKNLQKRILNIPSHVFGEHKRCQEFGYNCNTNLDSTKKKVVNYVPYLKAYNLYDKIEDPIKYLSCHAESLLHKVTNNMVESFNNIVCKEVCNKRLNLGCSNQYNTRIAIAVLQHNTQEAIIQIYKEMGKEVPDALESVINKRKAKVARTRMDRVMNGRKRKFFHSNTDKNYGPKCEKPDLSPNEIALLSEEHNKKLIDNQKDRINIEVLTRDQSNSDLWINIRKILLTASNFGRICRMRPRTSCSNLVKSLLFPTLNDTPAMAYGRETEDIARKELEKHLSKNIEINGLFIDPTDPRFGASPDGLIDDDGIVEIKNPFTAKDLLPEEAMNSFPHLNFIDKRTKTMKKTHHWYYQVQGQLHVTQRKYCMFALRTAKGMAIQRVERDDDFWNKNMKPQLSAFYDNCLLPEILDSRYLRNMQIRDPDYILEAKRQYDTSIKKKAVSKPNEKKQDLLEIIENNFEVSSIKLTEKKTSTRKQKNTKTTKRKKVARKNNRTSAKTCETENDIECFEPSEVLESTSDQSKQGSSKLDEAIRTVKDEMCKAYNDSSEDDDLVFVSHNTDPAAFDSAAKKSIQTFFETKAMQVNVNGLKGEILDVEVWLNDDVLDVFISILKENCNYDVQSIMYQYFQIAVEPVKSKRSIAILGGSCTNHWRVADYDGSNIIIYDSKPGYTGGKLVQNELNYVLKRFPNMEENNVVFKKIKTIQPDDFSCGVYAAALATCIVLGGDPSETTFSMDALLMRHHLLQVLQTKKLSQFPVVNA